MKSIVFFDLEINDQDKIVKVGALAGDSHIHHSSAMKLRDFLTEREYICGWFDLW